MTGTSAASATGSAERRWWGLSQGMAQPNCGNRPMRDPLLRIGANGDTVESCSLRYRVSTPVERLARPDRTLIGSEGQRGCARCALAGLLSHLSFQRTNREFLRRLVHAFDTALVRWRLRAGSPLAWWQGECRTCLIRFRPIVRPVVTPDPSRFDCGDARHGTRSAHPAALAPG